MIRTLIIALMILGCFASFAGNEWGNTLRIIMQLALGLLFLIEMFAAMRRDGLRWKGLSGPLNQWERAAFVLLSAGVVLKWLHWPFGSIALVLSAFLMLMVQLIRAVRWHVIKVFPTSKNITLSFMALVILTGSAGFTLKTQHWPFSDILILLCVVFFLSYVLMRIAFSLLKKGGAQLPTMKQHNPNGMFFVCFYGVWVVFIAWQSIAPQWLGMSLKFTDTRWPNAAYEFWESTDPEIANRGNTIVDIAETELYPAIEKAEQIWDSADVPSQEANSQQSK